MATLFPIAKPKRSIELIGEETVVRNKPSNVRCEEECLFASEYRRVFNKSYCAVYEDALVVSKGSATQGIASISESVHAMHMGFSIRAKMHVRSALYRPMRHALDAAVLVTDYISSGYFHWVGDVLPKIVLMQDFFGEEFSHIPILLPHAYAKPYCVDTLRILGISENRIFLIPKGRKVRVKNLYVFGDILAPLGTGNFRPSLMKRIRTMAHRYVAEDNYSYQATPLKHGEKKRVYISRSDAAYRCVQNESLLLPILEKHGFTIVTTSHMSIFEQIALCRSADLLLSVHGAGLTNMLWMHPGAKVAEIRRRGDAHNNCYFSLANALDISYFYSLANADSQNTHKASLTWDVAEATYFIEQLVQ